MYIVCPDDFIISILYHIIILFDIIMIIYHIIITT